jgi:hypothetical protein
VAISSSDPHVAPLLGMTVVVIARLWPWQSSVLAVILSVTKDLLAVGVL